MTAPTDGRIRLTILGGFLGSGKTTWLRHQLREGLIRESLVIVNEAAEVPVDDRLLVDVSRPIVLAGGCACCDGRAELIGTLHRICDARVGSQSQDARVDSIVLETSGLADPGKIVDAIRTDPVLVHHIVVTQIIVAVDALHGIEQLRTEPLNRPQIETADHLVVTKLDRTGGAPLRRLLATLRTLNPGATLSGTIMGSDARLPSFSGEAPEPLPGAPGAGGPDILATRLDLGPNVDWTAFSLWLSALLHARGEDIVRVKGVVRTPAGRLLLQSVRKIVQQPEVLPDEDIPTDGSVVFIGRGFTPQNLNRSLRRFAGLGER